MLSCLPRLNYWKISRTLIDKDVLFHRFLQAFTLFATHFLELCQLESLYPNVENQHMEVQHTCNGVAAAAESVVYTYLLQRGCSEDRHYGTQTVKISERVC